MAEDFFVDDSDDLLSVLNADQGAISESSLYIITYALDIMHNRLSVYRGERKVKEAFPSSELLAKRHAGERIFFLAHVNNTTVFDVRRMMSVCWILPGSCNLPSEIIDLLDINSLPVSGDLESDLDIILSRCNKCLRYFREGDTRFIQKFEQAVLRKID
ncbi:hypothetical protein [Acuticoccus kandeliae]|uniref:hypothetical protein n=1 Tax=Acuticoccus kandeliae TaxID=2073160 RepID=UPI00196AED95|nr:hypothetical protein [Acuticoccus kandeliae]